jgi:ribosomal protein S18 acetylase RimI-like enzyme
MGILARHASEHPRAPRRPFGIAPPRRGRAVNIRRATPADAPAISRLAVPLVEKYVAYAFEPESAARLLDSMTAQALRACIEGGYRYHVAEDEQGLAGVVGTRDDRHLYHLFVADRVRRQGLATRLWRTALSACREAGNAGDITVNSSRYAEGFYRKMGFRRERARCRAGIVTIEMRFPGADA